MISLSPDYTYVYNNTILTYLLDFVVAEDGDETMYVLDEKGQVIFSVTTKAGKVPVGLGLDWNYLVSWVAEKENGTLKISSTNRKTLEYEYSEPSPGISVENGKIILRKNDKYGVIDFEGKTLVDFNYDIIEVTSDAYAIVKVNEKYGAVDLKGNIAIPIMYDEILPGIFYK